MKKLTVAAGCLALLIAAGCGKKDESKSKDKAPSSEKPAATKTVDTKAKAPVAPSGSADAAAEAAKLYKTVCSTCHGETGKGDGAAAAALNPKPRDFTDAAWQKQAKDADLAAIIVKGGLGVNPPKSATMPANPTLKTKPAVVAELVKLIRGLGAK